MSMWGALLAGEGRAQSDPAPQPAQSQQQQGAPAPTAQQQVPDPGYYTASCERPKNHDEADLCEQQRQAQAAEDSVQWLAFQTKLGIGGFGAVVLSLIFTGWAAVAAGRAAKAAEAGVAVASESARRQLRAYIAVENGEGGIVRAGQKICLPLTLRNHGQTPALRTAMVARILVRGLPFRLEQEVGELGERVLPHERPAAVIHPRTDARVIEEMDEPLPDALFKRIEVDEAAVFFSGTIFYEDVFGERHETHFRFEFSGAECFRSGKMRISAQGNDAV